MRPGPGLLGALAARIQVADAGSGKYSAPQTTAENARADPLIDGRTKAKWVLVDPATLSQAARQVVETTTPQSVSPA